MGLPTCKHDHARHGYGPRGGNDRRKAPPRLCAIGRSAARLTLTLVLVLWPFATLAEGLRIATLHAELIRKGPGLLLRDIRRGADDQLNALKQINSVVRPDILFLSKVDFDAELKTAKALGAFLDYPHIFTLPPNSMVPTTLDLDGDGESADRQTWVRYAGEGAMLLLSRYPISLRFHLNNLLWRDFAGARLPIRKDGTPFPSEAVHRVQKLVGQGFWVIDVLTPDEPVTLVVFHNQTPAFDGHEDVNGLRNRDQLALLDAVMQGSFGVFPNRRFVLMGNANLDPERGQGDRNAIATLLADPRIQDPKPKSALGSYASAFWDRPGPMRVSYILPSWDWDVQRAEVFWPETGPLRKAAEQASRHRMVWADIRPRQE